MNASLNVEVFFGVKHTVAAILNYISTNFSSLIREPQLATNLTPQELLTVLSHQNLQVRSEDEVIEALIPWL